MAGLPVAAAGSEGNDIIDVSACSVAVILDGGAGVDELTGGLGDDVLPGGSGDDGVLVAGAGTHIVADGEGTSVIANNVGGAVSPNVGDAFTLNLSGLVPDDANATINWGDGALTTQRIRTRLPTRAPVNSRWTWTGSWQLFPDASHRNAPWQARIEVA